MVHMDVKILDLNFCRFFGRYSYFSGGNWARQDKLVEGKKFLSFSSFIHGFKLLLTATLKTLFLRNSISVCVTHGCKALLHDHTWSVESMWLWRKAWLIHFVSVQQFECQLEPDVDFALCCEAVSPHLAERRHGYASPVRIKYINI